MPTTETCLPQPSAIARRFTLFSFAAGKRNEGCQPADISFAQQADRQAQESAQLLRQISAKAPQLAAVLDQLNEGSTPQRVEFDALPASAATRRRFNGGSVLDAAAGLLSHAFPANAPLFHGCRALLQFRTIRNPLQEKR